MLHLILGIIVFLIDIWAIYNVVRSQVSFITKLLWVILILVLPVLGVIIWYFFGPRSK